MTAFVSFFFLSLKDFGDYSEPAYSVQTSDGEAISRLIAGYADIVTAQRSPAALEDAEYEEITEDLKHIG